MVSGKNTLDSYSFVSRSRKTAMLSSKNVCGFGLVDSVGLSGSVSIYLNKERSFEEIKMNMIY